MSKASNQSHPHIGQTLSQLVTLDGIYLIEGHCKRGIIKDEELPPIARQAFQFSKKIDEDAHKIQGYVVVKYRIDITYPDAMDDDATKIAACYIVRYGNGKVADKIPIDEIIEFMALQESYSSWTKFAQSMTLQMGLPEIPIPPFNIPKDLKINRKSKSIGESKAHKRRSSTTTKLR